MHLPVSEPVKKWDFHPENPGGPINSDLAVQNHHVLRVRGQPRLHGLTYGTDLIQRWGVEIGPAKVMNLVVEMERQNRV